MLWLELKRCWQKVLGLQDWYIILNFSAHVDDFQDRYSIGQCELRTVLKQAYIKILDEKCHKAYNKADKYDFELTLLHELMHVKLAYLDDSKNDLQNLLVHAMVEDMAKALVRAKRDKGKESE